MFQYGFSAKIGFVSNRGKLYTNFNQQIGQQDNQQAGLPI